MASKHVFLGQIVDSREVVRSLVWLHALQIFNRYWPVEPTDIKWGVLPLGQMELKVELRYFFDHVVVSVSCVHNKAIVAVSNLLWVLLTLLIVFVTRCEPIRVVRGISVTAIIIVIFFF